MKFSTYRTIGLLTATVLIGGAGINGCTNLDDKVYGALSSTDARPGAIKLDPTATLQGAYQALNPLATNQGNTYAMEEHSSDEMMGPTRGTDWDDSGRWRQLHQHTWNSLNDQILGAWNDLNTGAFRASQAVYAAGSNTALVAQGQFLRGFFTSYVVDLWGRVPVRLATDAADSNPQVLSRQAASNFVISDLRNAFATLPAYTKATANVATKEAAAAMLAKIYLNRAVYNQNPASPAGPYTFAKADMDSAIYFANQVIATAKFSLVAKGKYFDNFHWENDQRSNELIFTIQNNATAQPGSVQNRYFMTEHYNQYIGAWNGFTTLADFYNSFEAADERRSAQPADLTPLTGLTAGFQVGQQFGPGAIPLKDRSGNPLAFTPQVNINSASEIQGIRVIKYLPNPVTYNNPTNDYVFLRYADVLLMKAEAIARGGTDPQGQTAATIVNNLRTTRGATTLSTVDLPAILAERGRELYWEGWRRSDAIRFGTFLNPVDQRPTKSPDTAVLFPFPQQAIDSNPNLQPQNAGY
ncbi:RagB/SusD family nutrient uptake outer membrane protein [uncultured Fibrella sp.]|uniref:RagB/SusD family nutrient uptake outer membrane protein n=1 Tax=uncultured Fibrella sp. TaxID=1284596 RepID=UPI0035CAFDDB